MPNDSLIVKPLTEDKLFGLDQFGQLLLGRHDGHGMIFTSAHDVREATCALCGHGWLPTGPSIGDQTFWQLLGEVVHETCHSRHYGFVERAEVRDAICDAHIRFEKLCTEPNGYYGEKEAWGKYRPWYYADMLDHPYRIRIGHRKRVWEIVVTPNGRIQAAERLRDSKEPLMTIPWHVEALAAFEPENKKGITQDIGERKILLHAYGTANMTEYVARLAKVGGLVAKGY